jgi:SAM-dependent methyltransferase
MNAQPEKNIYDNPKFLQLDIGDIMRAGHPDIDEGDRHIVKVIKDLRRSLNRPLRIIDVGSGSGGLSLMLARELPDSQVIANEIAAAPAAQARAKLAPFPRASVFERPFAEWNEKVDVVVSWGSHHHLSHDYLDHVRKVLSKDGLFLVGDELCPEYFTQHDRDRVNASEKLVIQDGYLFDNERDLELYRRNGTIPAWSRGLEEGRRRALWTWYKFVGDYALAKGAWDVLISELQIAQDDLITEFAGEHKTSSHLLEREIKLAGFNVTERMTIGDRAPELQSFVVFTCRAAC